MVKRIRHLDWEAIFHGSRRRVSTVIIGCLSEVESGREFLLLSRGLAFG